MYKALCSLSPGESIGDALDSGSIWHASIICSSFGCCPIMDGGSRAVVILLFLLKLLLTLSAISAIGAMQAGGAQMTKAHCKITLCHQRHR